MVSWSEFARIQPELADDGRGLLYPPLAPVGLAYLATVRRDGGPRLHPMCPMVSDLGLFALIVPGPKCDDLSRDGRYAMHSFPLPDNEDGFYLTGRAAPVEDDETRERIVKQFLDERQAIGLTREQVSDQRPFEFAIATAMLTRTKGHGDPDPRHTIWHADR